MAIGTNLSANSLQTKKPGSTTRDIADALTLNPTLFVVRTAAKIIQGEGPCEAVDHTFNQVRRGVGSLLSKVTNVLGQ